MSAQDQVDPRRQAPVELEYWQISKADELLFTYDVRWEYSDVKWASRWDVYLYATDEQSALACP